MTPTFRLRLRRSVVMSSAPLTTGLAALLRTLRVAPQLESFEERTGVEPLRSKGAKFRSTLAQLLIPSASTRAPLVTSGSADDFISVHLENIV